MNDADSEGESLTTESFLFICKQAKLTLQEMELMDIGDILDYIEYYAESINPDKSRKARQRDFDAF